MGGIGFPELLIALVIIMIIFGAGKIPSLGSAFGNTIRNFKQSMKESDDQEVSVANISQLSEEKSSDGVKAIPETLDNANSNTPKSPDAP